MADPAITGLAAGGFVLFFFVIFIAIFVLSILAMIFWIFMIVDAAKRKFNNENDKTLWILVVVLAGVIGAIVYYFVIKKPDKH